MPTALITGTNRGIGLALVKEFLNQGWTVLACCRNPSSADELQTLTNNQALSIHPLDVSDDSSINALRITLSYQPIDLLLNNAGIAGDVERSNINDMNYSSWEDLFKINTIAPVKILEAFLPNLEASKHKHVVTISSALASITNQEGHMLPYSSSKTALNSAMKSLSVLLKDRGLRVNMLSPGWVKTDMGGPDAMISPEQSAALLYQNITMLDTNDTGKFIGHEGDIYPW